MSALTVGRRNALLAFGDGNTIGCNIMWGGIYTGAKAYTLQSLNPKTYEVKADLFIEDEEMDQNKVFDIRIEVDFTNRIAILMIDGKLKGKIEIPKELKQITYYGYAHHKNTITYYSDIYMNINR